MAFPPSIRAGLAIISGLMTQFVLVSVGHDLESSVRSGLGLLAAGLLVYGCTVIAERRGYSPWAGLAGLFSILGVGLLLILPSRDALPRPLIRTPFRDAHTHDKED